MQTVDGAFVEAAPVEDTIVVNIGLLLENWTNGRLRATRHRVVRPTDEERMSLVLFALPDEGVWVEPLQDLKREDDPIHYKAVSAQEFCRQLLSEIV